ncbi:MAG: hypothetical protein WHT46_03060 [Candidatus Geothermincolales bacterium]
MEFLVFLLLGFAAVLLVIPSIIRGRLEESPVATADYFQKSMNELGRSLHIDDPRVKHQARIPGRTAADFTRAGVKKLGSMSQRGHKPDPGTVKTRRLSRAEIRRNRIMATLLANSLLWGTVALFTGRFWALILFTLASLMFTLYWLAAFTLVSSSHRKEDRHQDAQPDAVEDGHRTRARLP